MTTFLGLPTFLLAAFLPFYSLLLEGLPAGSPLPSRGGDWVVRTPVVLYDITLTVRGRLIVERGGSLEVHGVYLRLVGERDGESGVEVRQGGSFSAFRSGLTGRATRIDKGDRRGRYEFHVSRGGRFFLSEVEIRGAGWDVDHPGLVVEGAPGERSDEVMVFRSDLHDNFVGITLRGGAGTVVLSRFHANRSAGLALDRSRAHLAGVDVRDEVTGVRLVDGSDALFDGVELVENDVALSSRDGSPTIVHSVFAANRIHAVFAGGGAPFVQDSIFVLAGETGVLVREASAPLFDHDDFARNAVAVRNERGDVGPAVTAAENYWGAADGPSGAGSGGGDPVTEGVAFTPWCTTTCVR